MEPVDQTSFDTPHLTEHKQPLWRRLLERSRNRRLTLSEMRDMRDAARRVPRRQLQIFLGLIDMQLQRSDMGAERKRLVQLRCHISTRMIVEKHISLGHLPGGVRMEAVLAEVCRCISEGFRDATQNHLYWRLGPVDVDQDSALPIALLLSETLAECMSLAIDQPFQRRIDVALNRIDHDEAELTIKDNCYEPAELAKRVLHDNPLPQRFALRCGANLRVSEEPNFTLQAIIPTAL